MTFELEIVAADGIKFKGEAERIVVRSAVGDVAILPRHIDYVTTIAMGEARITAEGVTKKAACIGGLLAVTGGKVRLVPTSFEWKEDIDMERTERSIYKAKAVLDDPKDRSKADIALAEARLKRALVRQNVGK